MKLTTIIILMFLLGAFAIGVTLTETESLTPQNISESIDQTNLTSIELPRSTSISEGIIDVNSIITILESYIRFILTFTLEIVKVGINFGYENPNYFEASYLIGIIKLIIILLIVSLLIKPLFYLGIIIVLMAIWLKDKTRRKTVNEN